MVLRCSAAVMIMPPPLLLLLSWAPTCVFVLFTCKASSNLRGFDPFRNRRPQPELMDYPLRVKKSPINLSE